MKRIPIAIVGLNFGSCIIEKLLQGPEGKYFRVAAVCDMDQAKAESVARSLGCKAYSDLDLLLQDRAIPAIGLFTGPNGRAKLLQRIIRAGKDVMTTKPFELDPELAHEVLLEARRRKRIIHLNSPSPLPSLDLAQIAQWRQEFDLGRPIACRADAWARKHEKADGSWYDDPKRCPVAPVFRLGIYLINDLIGFFGTPAEVHVFHSRLFTGRPTPDNAQVGIRFKNGGLVTIFSSFCIDDTQSYRNSLTLNFERGTIYRNVGPFPRLPGTEDDAAMTLITQRNGKPLVRRKIKADGLSGIYQWKAFHQAILGAKLGRTATPQEIVAGIKVVTAMARSEKSGQTEKV